MPIDTPVRTHHEETVVNKHISPVDEWEQIVEVGNYSRHFMIGRQLLASSDMTTSTADHTDEGMLIGCLFVKTCPALKQSLRTGGSRTRDYVSLAILKKIPVFIGCEHEEESSLFDPDAPLERSTKRIAADEASWDIAVLTKHSLVNRARPIHSGITLKQPGLHPLARQFEQGVDGDRPDSSVVRMVDRIARDVEAKTVSFVYSIDEDGAFSFDARLESGLFIMCEVDISGEINAGLYHGPSGELEKFLARTKEEELLGYL